MEELNCSSICCGGISNYKCGGFLLQNLNYGVTTAVWYITLCVSRNLLISLEIKSLLSSSISMALISSLHKGEKDRKKNTLSTQQLPTITNQSENIYFMQKLPPLSSLSASCCEADCQGPGREHWAHLHTLGSGHLWPPSQPGPDAGFLHLELPPHLRPRSLTHHRLPIC